MRAGSRTAASLALQAAVVKLAGMGKSYPAIARELGIAHGAARRLGRRGGVPRKWQPSPEHMAKLWSSRPVKDRTDPVARFWAKVRKSDGCWEWTGARQECGH